VKLITMRKLFALSMVALLALTLAIAALGCGQKAEETPAATETPAAETMMDSTAAMTDSSAMMSTDSTAAH
jgi:outer membrane lipoprotein-sorting protein